MPTLATPTRCTGCTACASACPKGCITISADTYGFPGPRVDSSQCVSCGKCEQACPVLNPPKPAHTPTAFAAQSRDEAMRLGSSSGGIFSELARPILARGGAVFGAAYGPQFQVRHICAETEADLAQLQGAKYAQSDLGTTFRQVKEHLLQGQAVLFSGTPCQLAGLHSFLGRQYDNLVTVDFVCHGVPSPLVWEEYVRYRAEQDCRGTAPCAINLRSKDSGWSRYRYSNRFCYPDGTCHSTESSQSLFMKLFVGDFINRDSCATCPFKGYSRVSDFTLGDFWGIWDILPELDDDKGTSLVLVQSEKGRKLWAQISSHLTVREVTLDQASQQNGSLLYPSKAKENRGLVLETVRMDGIEKCVALFPSPAPSLAARLKGYVKRLITR